jgi:DNA polymerase zeta
VEHAPCIRRSTALAAMGDDGGAGRDHTSDLHVVGRVVLNLWRMMRDELKLQSYRFENVIAAVLRERIPHIPQGQLHVWFCSVHSRPR